MVVCGLLPSHMLVSGLSRARGRSGPILLVLDQSRAQSGQNRFVSGPSSLAGVRLETAVRVCDRVRREWGVWSDTAGGCGRMLVGRSDASVRVGHIRQ